jgi:hypothetical protein
MAFIPPYTHAWCARHDIESWNAPDRLAYHQYRAALSR